MMKSNSVCIGDGVYLRDDGHQLWLAVGDHKSDVVALDPTVTRSLVKQALLRGVIDQEFFRTLIREQKNG